MRNKKSKLILVNVVLLFFVVLLTAYPLFFHPKGSEFGGADSQGSALVEQEHPDYKVWFHPMWEPPSGEIESLMFALQAGIGAGVFGYFLGYLKGKKHKEEQADAVIQAKDIRIS